MKTFKSHFELNKRQRNGIFFLMVLMVLPQMIYFVLDRRPVERTELSPETLAIQLKLDSIAAADPIAPVTKVYPFNPNFLSEYKAYILGISADELKRLTNFRAAGKFVNNPTEFQNVTGISDSLLAELGPLFKFPEFKSNRPKKVEREFEILETTIPEKDQNLVTQSDLQKVKGVGEKLSQRIVAYRELLKGFTEADQLGEVYFLPPETAQEILKVYPLLSKPDIDKVDVNRADFKEILALPYIDYKLTRQIFQYKTRFGQFNSLEDLKKIDSFPLDKYERIALYLSAN